MRRFKRKPLISIFSLILLVCVFSFSVNRSNLVDGEELQVILNIKIVFPYLQNESHQWYVYYGQSTGLFLDCPAFSVPLPPGYGPQYSSQYITVEEKENSAIAILPNTTALRQKGSSGSFSSIKITVDYVPKEFTITCNKGDSQNSEFYEKYNTGFSLTKSSGYQGNLSVNVPTKTGYSFNGYYTGSNGTGTKVVNSDGKIAVSNTFFTSNSTVYAYWSANTYTNTLSYNANGGSGAPGNSTATVTYPNTQSSHTVSSSGATPYSKTGYTVTFDGWYTAATNGSKVSGSVTVGSNNNAGNQSRTLYAGWKETGITYTNSINYDANGGTNAPSATTGSVQYPNTSTSLTLTSAQPSRTGYTFDGWYPAAEGGSKYGTSTTVGSNNVASNQSITVYAHWTANNYTNTLKFDLNGGAGSIDPITKTVTYPNTSCNIEVTPTIPTLTAFKFVGWYTAKEGGTEVTNPVVGVDNNAGNQELTVFAHWELQEFDNILKYDLVGGQNGPADDVRKVIYPDTQYEHDVDSTTIPTKEGYTFEAWYDAVEGGNLITGKFIVGERDVIGAQTDTLYAHWTPNSYTNTIHYDWGEGTGGPESSSHTVTFPTTYKLIPIDPKVPTMVGHTFSGWFTDDGKQEIGNVILGSEYVARDQEMTLHARYEANVYTNTIKYDTNGGEGQPNDDAHDVTYPNTFYEHTITSKIPTKKGHVFLGWFTDPVGGVQIEGKYTLGEAGEVANRSLTLYAHWEVNTFTNTLKYDANGGTGAPDDNPLPVTYPKTQSIHDVNSVTIPSRTGYTFGGWYTDKEWTTEAKGTITVGEDDGGENQIRTLYAKWDLIEYDITYILHDGEAKLPNKESYNIESDTFTLHYPERAGYVFGGWTGSNGDVAQLGVTIQKGSIGDRTYEAIWLTEKDIYYKVNYYKMNTDGTTYSLSETNLRLGESGSKVQIGDLIKAYDGFTFEGGAVAPASEINPRAYDTEATVLGDKSTVINMYYERNKYEVTLEKDSGVDEVLGMGTYFFEEVISISARMLPGYSFVYWTGTLASTVKDFIFNMPAGDVLLSVRSELNKEASFTVNHYTITKDKKGYELKETETRRNVAESVMKISDLVKTYDEFSFEGGKVAPATEVKPDVFDITVTIAMDGSTVINMYYGPKVYPSSGGGKTPSIVISDADPTIKKDETQSADDALKKIEVKNGKIIYVPVPGEIQKEGFKFEGYFYDTEFTKPVKVGDKITGDMNFFAKWEEVEKLTLKKKSPYISGYDDGEFKPKRNMTRAELCAVIAGLFEEYDDTKLDEYIEFDKNFGDVRTDFWYTPYIGFVISNDIMNGYAEGKFNPNANVTRAEVCKVLTNVFNIESKNVENKFKDELKGQWYEKPVTTLVEAGLINGYEDGTFKGNNNITRAELVILINRITGKTISDEEANKLDVPFKDLKKTNWYYKDILIASR